MQYEPHEYANLFPMMRENEYQELLASMKKNGYFSSCPIILFEGAILDGRNRYRAAQELNILPMFINFAGDKFQAYEYARATNFAQKIFTSDQRAMIAQDLMPYETELAKQRKSEGGKAHEGNQYTKTEDRAKQPTVPDKGRARAKVAQKTGVSEAKVKRAQAVKNKDTELAEQVKQGEVTLAQAESIVKARAKKEKKEQKEQSRKKAEPVQTETVYNVKNGQTWQCGNHTVICGDAYKLLCEIKADAVITDPPYGIDYKPDWNKWDGSKGDFRPIIGDDSKFNPVPFLNYKTVLLFGANYYSDLLPLGGWLCWDKRTREELDEMFGSPFELAWYRSYITNRKSIMVRLLHGGVVNADSKEGNNEKRHHATQKPIELMREIIEMLAKKNDVILDPFAGSGATLLACERLGMKSISIEIDAANVEVILRRYEKESGVIPCQA